jgi:hypothetical protein
VRKRVAPAARRIVNTSALEVRIIPVPLEVCPWEVQVRSTTAGSTLAASLEALMALELVPLLAPAEGLGMDWDAVAGALDVRPLPSW